jgi:hypothetical protein
MKYSNIIERDPGIMTVTSSHLKISNQIEKAKSQCKKR